MIQHRAGLKISFVRQTTHGIDSRRAARGQVACNQAASGENRRNSGEGQRVGGGYAPQLARHETRESEAYQEADHDPRSRQLQAVAERCAQNPNLRCTQGDADSDFMRPRETV
jgi:hypothetical protein